MSTGLNVAITKEDTGNEAPIAWSALSEGANQTIVVSLALRHRFAFTLTDELRIALKHRYPEIEVEIEDIYFLCPRYAVFTTCGVLAQRILSLSEPLLVGEYNTATFHSGKGYPTTYLTLRAVIDDDDDKDKSSEYLGRRIDQNLVSLGLDYSSIREDESFLVRFTSPENCKLAFEKALDDPQIHVELITVDMNVLVQARVELSGAPFKERESHMLDRGTTMANFFMHQYRNPGLFTPQVIHAGLAKSDDDSLLNIVFLRKGDADIAQKGEDSSMKLPCEAKIVFNASQVPQIASATVPILAPPSEILVEVSLSQGHTSRESPQNRGTASAIAFDHSLSDCSGLTSSPLPSFQGFHGTQDGFLGSRSMGSASPDFNAMPPAENSLRQSEFVPLPQPGDIMSASKSSSFDSTFFSTLQPSMLSLDKSMQHDTVSQPPSIFGERAPATFLKGLQDDNFSGMMGFHANEDLHKGSVIFRDTNVMLFYGNFEAPFSLFAKKTFNVELVPVNQAVYSAVQNGKVTFVQVEIRGEDRRNIDDCQKYLEQLNADDLRVEEIFLPSSDMTAHRELVTRKLQQDAVLSTMRQQEGSAVGNKALPGLWYASWEQDAGKMVLDPMVAEGFLSIHVTPPVSSRGINRITEAVDLTVTLLSFQRTEKQRELMDSMVAYFNSFETDFYIGSISLPVGLPVVNDLMDRAKRDDIAAAHGLVCIRFESSKSIARLNGMAGVVKIWANSLASLLKFLRTIEDLGGVLTQVLKHGRSNAHRDSSSQPTPSLQRVRTSSHEQESRTASWDLGLSTLEQSRGHLDSSMSMAARNFSAPPGQSAAMGPSGLGPPSLGLKSYSKLGNVGHQFGRHESMVHGIQREDSDWTERTSGSGFGLSDSLSSAMNSISMGSNQSLPHTQILPRKNSNRGMQSAHMGEGSCVIRWPQQSFRFIFLCKKLKMQLADKLQELREAYGINTVCPHRERGDPFACILLIGDPHTLKTPSMRISAYMQEVLHKMRSVQVIFSQHKWNNLVSTDLVLVRKIQGLCGVHIILDPESNDVFETTSVYDLRLPYSTPVVTQSLDPSLEEPPKPSSKLMIAALGRLQSPRNVILTIYREDADLFVRDCPRMFIVCDGDARFDAAEMTRMKMGEVLVKAVGLDSTVHLYVYAERAEQAGVDAQASAYARTLGRGLSLADSMNIRKVAVSSPTTLDAFPDLLEDAMRSLVIRSVVQFTTSTSAGQLEEIICLERSSKTGEEKLIEPCGGSVMVSTLLKVIERHTELHTRSSGGQKHPRMQLLAVNVPLPKNTSAEAFLPNHGPSSLSHFGGSLLRNNPAASRRVSIIVLRGLPDGVAAGIEMIRSVSDIS